MLTRGSFGLDQEEAEQIDERLEAPPSTGAADPAVTSPEHRPKLRSAIEQVVEADGKVMPAETESLELIRDVVSGDA